MYRQINKHIFLDRVPIRFRLAIFHTIWMAILFAAIGVGTYNFFKQNLYQSVDAALRASAESLRSARELVSYRSSMTHSFLREVLGESYIKPIAQLVDLSGKSQSYRQSRLTQLPITPLAASRGENGLSTFETIKTDHQIVLRQLTVPIIYQGKFTGELIQVAAPLSPVYKTLRELALMLWIVLPLGLLFSIVAGYFFMGRSLRPVVELSNMAEKLEGHDLHLRLPLPKAHDEIGQLARAFNRMLDRLDDAFSRMSRFAADVSHELRTPLAVLRAEAELALRRPRSREEYQEALSTIVQESKHMTTIIEDLLLLARAQSQSVALNPQPIIASQFIAELIDSIQNLADEKNLKIKYSLKEDFTLEGSKTYLGLAIKNILINAIKHSPQGQTIEVIMEKQANTVKISVQDHGEGIPASVLPYIFDPFFRADTARNRRLGGTGIGLSLAQALVKLHHGRIEVESQVNEGSRFTTFIPCMQPQLIDHTI